MGALESPDTQNLRNARALVAFGLEPDSGQTVCGLLPSDVFQKAKNANRWDDEESMMMHMRGYNPVLTVPFSPDFGGPDGLVLGSVVKLALERAD